MGNLDTSGPTQAASGSFGWINAAKGILIPLYLLWRVGGTSAVARMLPARIWMGLIAYATIAALWAPFPMAAVKLIGNLLGILLAAILLERSVRFGLLGGGSLILLILSSLALAAIQTYYYGGASYGFDGLDQPSRFSSFISAQQFGAFLVAFLAVVLWHRSLTVPSRAGLSALLCTALLLNGSRTWFLGAALVVAVYVCLSFRRAAIFGAFALASLTLLLLLGMNLQPMRADSFDETSSRIAATFSAIVGGNETSRNIGLANINFRLTIYEAVIEELRRASPWQLLFGHGTSSGGTVVLRIFPNSYHEDTLDANRAIHDEWLRALYEWGIVGFALLVGVFATLIAGLVRRYRNPSTKQGAIALLSFLPAFALAFSTENILAGAGNAVTMSIAIMIGMLWAEHAKEPRLYVEA
jgi:O-antigen ligase